MLTHGDEGVGGAGALERVTSGEGTHGGSGVGTWAERGVVLAGALHHCDGGGERTLGARTRLEGHGAVEERGSMLEDGGLGWDLGRRGVGVVVVVVRFGDTGPGSVGGGGKDKGGDGTLDAFDGGLGEWGGRRDARDEDFAEGALTPGCCCAAMFLTYGGAAGDCCWQC